MSCQLIRSQTSPPKLLKLKEEAVIRGGATGAMQGEALGLVAGAAAGALLVHGSLKTTIDEADMQAGVGFRNQGAVSVGRHSCNAMYCQQSAGGVYSIH